MGKQKFERNKHPVVKKTPSGQPSTDEDVLQELALNYPLPKLILEYRALSKLKSTYTDKLPRMVNPRYRPRAHQLRAGGSGDRDACPATIPTCRTSPSATPKDAASAKRSSRRPDITSYRPTTPRSSCGSWRTCRRIRPARVVCLRRRCASAHRSGSVRRARGRADQRAAPLRQGDQFRLDLRDVGVRAREPTWCRAQRCAAVHGSLLCALSRCCQLHAAYARSGARKGLRRDGVRAPPVHDGH